jgi:hypothetical protein
VRLPGNWLFPRPRTAEITSLGTDYDGALDLILGRPDPAARNSWEPDPGWPQAVREAYAARASEANTG